MSNALTDKKELFWALNCGCAQADRQKRNWFVALDEIGGTWNYRETAPLFGPYLICQPDGSVLPAAGDTPAPAAPVVISSDAPAVWGAQQNESEATRGL